MSSPLNYSIVLPAYQESQNLDVLVPIIKTEMQAIGGTFEIVVVDTPTAMDDTAKVCERHGATYINRTPSSVFGDAVRTGIERAQGSWIIFMDADGSHSPDFISKLIQGTSQADVVIASRYIKGGATENSFLLVFLSRLLNWTYATVLGLHIKDVSNSFKIYPSERLRALNLTCNNFDIIEEILYKLKRSDPKLRILELPYTFHKRLFGETKRNLWQFIATYLVTIFRLRFSGRATRDTRHPTP